jgi:hypothetical protein
MKSPNVQTSKRLNVQTSKRGLGFGLFDFWTFGRLSAAAVVFLADSALAQAPGRVPGQDAGYLQWIIFGGIGVVVCATGFLNSKRSHLN